MSFQSSSVAEALSSQEISADGAAPIKGRGRKGSGRGLAQGSALQPLGNANRVTLVVEQLTRSVLSGEMQPGSLLPPERELASHLGVSRNAVREATKIMQSRGLLAVKQGLGTVVMGVTSEPGQQMFSNALWGQEDALLHLTEVRLSLEVKIAELAALRATPEAVARLRALIERLGASLEDIALYADLDVEFHREIAGATQNPLFVLMLESAASLLRESRLNALQTGSTAISQAAHRAIFEAIEKRDAPAAAEAMRLHLESQKQDFETRFSRDLAQPKS